MDRNTAVTTWRDVCGSDTVMANGIVTGRMLEDFAQRIEAAERERAALVCDDEARIRTEAGNTHPEDSESRGRCFAAARAAINCAKGVRNGELVPPNALDKPQSEAKSD